MSPAPRHELAPPSRRTEQSDERLRARASLEGRPGLVDRLRHEDRDTLAEAERRVAGALVGGPDQPGPDQG